MIHSKRLKGDMGLFTLTFLLMFVIIAALGAYWYTSNEINRIKVKVDVAVDKVDTGTWAVSFFSVSDGNINYLEALGSAAAENYRENVGAYIYTENANAGFLPIESLLQKWSKTEKPSRAIIIQDKLKLGETGKDAERFLVDIPAPGGQKLTVEIREDKII